MDTENTVSAIIPARNEEAVIARVVESLAVQPEIAEILVVNDHSTDGTARILSELAARMPRLRILEADPLPEGWIGKNHAQALGAAQARGRWLLFSDADTLHFPGSTAHALADAAQFDAALVSYSPEQETRTWWERALIPFIFCRLAQLFPFHEVNHPDSPLAAANGQYLLVRRGVYDAIGGHRAVRGEVLEDVALAQRAKARCFRIHFASGRGIVRTHMYRLFGEMWLGWTKNLYPLVGGTPSRLARELLTVFPWIPLLLIALTSVQWFLWALGLLLLVGRHVAYGALLRRNHLPLSRILYYSVGVFLYVAILVASFRRYASGSVEWKGREYPVGRWLTDNE